MKTIAIVDDDELVRATLEEHLAAAGFAVISAPDTIVARLRLSGGTRIDLCLVDLVMHPGVPDGLEFSNWLSSERPQTPIILMTGYYAAALRIDNQAWPILYKPILIEELLAEISRRIH